MPCKLKDIPQIQVGGLSSEAKIYGIDFSMPTDKSAGTVTVQVAGSANINLSASSPVEISIGNFSFVGYPIKKSIRCTPTAPYITSITYIDGSIILDKTFVGLWGKHSPASGDTLSVENYYGTAFNMRIQQRNGFRGSWPLLIVGDFIDPCMNPELYEIKDPCDPCPQQREDWAGQTVDTAGLKYINCTEQRQGTILQTDYTFGELLGSVSGFGGININKSPKLNDSGPRSSQYRASYVGTLRSVLNTWCRDYGLTYDWDSSKNNLNFYDVTSGISVNSKGLENHCEVIEYEKTSSIENTSTHSIIAYHGREGDLRDYKCSYDYGKRVVCRPITLKDLCSGTPPEGQVSDGYVDTNGWTLNSYDLLEWLCLLSAHSPKLRFTFTWLNIYGCVAPNFVKRKLDRNGRISGIPGISHPYKAYYNMEWNDHRRGIHSLPALKMTIKEVITYEDNRFIFNYIYENILSEEHKQYILGGAKESNEIVTAKKNAYFFVARQDEENYKKQQAWEQAIASGFLGQFFIRKFKGISSAGPDLSQGSNARAKYYTRGTPVTEFSNFYTHSGVGGFVDELTREDGGASNNFILVNKDVQWLPPLSHTIYLERYGRMAEKVTPIDLEKRALSFQKEINDAARDALSNQRFGDKHPNAATMSFDIEDKLWMGKKHTTSDNGIGAYSVGNLKTYNTHLTERPSQIKVQGYSTPVKLGLRSLSAKRVFFEGMSFWFPPQATVRENEGSGRGNHIPYAGGYMVFAQQVISSTDYKVIPKVEVFARSILSPGDAVGGSLDLKSFSAEDIDIYNWDKYENRCTFNEGKYKSIQEEMKSWANDLTYSTGADYTLRVTLGCMPETQFDLGDGLKNISIRLENGVKATYTFSTVHRQAPSEAVVTQNHRNIHQPPLFGMNQSSRNNRPYNEGNPNSPTYPSEDNFPTV